MRRLVQFIRQHLLVVIFTLAAFVVGLVIGLLIGHRHADWVEAVGTWFTGFVALYALVLAVRAFNSEEFARRLDRAQSDRIERATLQQDADLVVCVARVLYGHTVEDEFVVPTDLMIEASNVSGHPVTDVACQVPQLGEEWIHLSELILPGDEATKRIAVIEPFRVRGDSRELHESATFTFSLGRVRWSTQYGQLAERLDP